MTKEPRATVYCTVYRTEDAPGAAVSDEPTCGCILMVKDEARCYLLALSPNTRQGLCRFLEPRSPRSCSAPHTLPLTFLNGLHPVFLAAFSSILLPLFASRFLPIALFISLLRSQSPATIMHAQLLPRKPTAMKQALAGLVLTSFLFKHGEWTLA